MKRFVVICAVGALAFVCKPGHAMPLGMRTLMHGHVVARQSAETDLPTQEWSVTFDANGGTGGISEKLDCGRAITVPTVTRTGYTFMDWTPAVAATMPASNVIYTAQWRANAYAVTYNANGGSGEMTSCAWRYDVEDVIPSNRFERVGHLFSGWGTNETGDVIFADGAVVSNLTAVAGGNVTLFAHWTPCRYTILFHANNGTDDTEEQYFTYGDEVVLRTNTFSVNNRDFAGWACESDGLVAYADGVVFMDVSMAREGVIHLYAMWNARSLWSDDGAYNPLVANVYDGYILDGDGALAGIIQVKAAKQAVKTATDKVTKVKTVTTNVAVTATVTDAAGKKWSYKGDGTVDGVVTGLVCTTKGVLVPSFGVTLGANGLDGEWGDFLVAGARNGMGVKGDAMMTALDVNYKKSWSVTFTNELGATRLQLVVGAKGSTKISGVTPDGYKISATVQGIMGEDAFFVPYLATLKNGKLTRTANLLLTLGRDGTVDVRTSDLGALKAGGPTVDEIEVQEYAESAVSKGGEAYAGAVVLNDLAYPAKFAAKGLPAGLKIDAATGAITGIPTKPGRYTATITVTSGVNSKKKVVTTVDFVIGNYTDEAIKVEDSYSGFCVGVMVNEPIAGALDCAVSGLPAGLKFAAKETKDATFGVVPAGTVYGVPAKAGEYTVYFKKTEKVNGKSVNRQASATFKVEALPAWAQGTFDGAVERGTGNGEQGTGEESGTVTLTVDAKGKISGKLLEGGLTWTLSAGAFSRVERVGHVEGDPEPDGEELVFYATIIGKAGKLAFTNEVTVAAYPSGLAATSPASGEELIPYGAVSGGDWTAWQNLWKRTDTKAAMPVIKKDIKVDHWLDEKGDTDNKVTLTFKKDGVVAFAGLVDGVKVSGSSQLVRLAEDGSPYQVTLYAPPKPTAKPPFEGWCETLAVTLIIGDQGVVTGVDVK